MPPGNPSPACPHQGRICIKSLRRTKTTFLRNNGLAGSKRTGPTQRTKAESQQDKNDNPLSSSFYKDLWRVCVCGPLRPTLPSHLTSQSSPLVIILPARHVLFHSRPSFPPFLSGPLTQSLAFQLKIYLFSALSDPWIPASIASHCALAPDPVSAWSCSTDHIGLLPQTSMPSSPTSLAQEEEDG